MKATTVREARILELLPSSTTMLSIWRKPGLDNYVENQTLRAGMKASSLEEARELAGAHRREAADLGKLLHLGFKDCSESDSWSEAWQAVMSSNRLADVPEREEWYRATLEPFFYWIREQPWTNRLSEVGRALPGEGYAGTADLAAFDRVRERPIIVDFKTNESMEAYEEWLPQLWSYAHLWGFDDARLVNVIVSRSEPGRIEIKDWAVDKRFRGGDADVNMREAARESFFDSRAAWYGWLGPGYRLPKPWVIAPSLV